MQTRFVDASRRNHSFSLRAAKAGIVSNLLRVVIIGIGLWQGPAAAQVTSGGAVPPPDDTPSVRVGGDAVPRLHEDIRAEDHGRQWQPREPGRLQRRTRVHQHHGPAQSHHCFPDYAGHHARNRDGQLDGRQPDLSLEVRLVQVNLDDWLWRGSYVRAGMIQTPYVEFEEAVYRYRFQGTVFIDREGYNTSADFGTSFRTQFPGGFGEFVGGLYNGDGYTGGSQ